MTSAIVLAFASAFCFGAGLVLTQLGLRYLSPLSGAAIAIPSSTLLLICISPVALTGSTVAWNAVAIFAAVGLLYPGAATLLTFAANRALGPVITGTLGNLAPLFAVAGAPGTCCRSSPPPSAASSSPSASSAWKSGRARLRPRS